MFGMSLPSLFVAQIIFRPCGRALLAQGHHCAMQIIVHAGTGCWLLP
jgi:hypothetical protein